MKMKQFKYLLLAGIAAGSLLSACSEDTPERKNSVFNTSSEPKSEFDQWLKTNYIDAFNIDYKYRMEDIESDLSKNLAPADLLQSMRLAKIIKHVWLEAYVETAGIDFMRKHAPAILHVVGSASWNGDGTMTLGVAEGGLKITLYMVNWLNPSNIKEMNQYFFKTMHHEFTHILQQDINYPQEYNLISAEDYRPSGWHNRHNIADYASLGFITNYAGSMPVEDITEITCCYVTFTDEEWNAVFEAAGEAGRAKLNQKVKIMKQYMLDVWKIDMDLLKEVVRRRMNEVVQMKLLEPSWTSPLTTDPATGRAALQLLEQQLRTQYAEALEEMDAHPDGCHIHNANLINILQRDKN